ncbi:MAG: 2-dehydropantoate 2-reductase [Opitutaceae bacterium]
MSVPSAGPEGLSNVGGSLSRIAVVGSGAVGAYYGARLAHRGEDVSFLVRSDREIVRDHGWTIRVTADPAEEFVVRPVKAFRHTREMGPVDLVIVALKATSNDLLPSLLPPLLHEKTAILTLQNGLGSDEWIAARFGPERVLGGLCFVCLNRTAPGVVECYHRGSMVIGECGRLAGPRVQAIVAAFREAGVECAAADNLLSARWHKLVWNVPFNGLSIAGGGVTTDRILASETLAAEAGALMREVQAAAAAFGVIIPDAFLARQIEVTRPMGACKPSSLVDFLAGRAVEVEAIWGEPLRRAQSAGVKTPRLAALHDRLGRICLQSG